MHPHDVMTAMPEFQKTKVQTNEIKSKLSHVNLPGIGFQLLIFDFPNKFSRGFFFCLFKISVTHMHVQGMKETVSLVTAEIQATL